jgi:hypothetical protein
MCHVEGGGYSCTHSHIILPTITLYNYLFELQSFLEKDNFASKSTKAKDFVKICLVRIEKK